MMKFRNFVLGLTSAASVLCMQDLAEGAEPIALKFYQRPFRPDVVTYNAPFVEIGENQEFGKYIYQVDSKILPWNSESLFSVVEGKYVYNVEYSNIQLIKKTEKADFYKIFSPSLGVMINFFYNSYFNSAGFPEYNENELDVSCELFDNFLYVSGDKRPVGKRNRLFFITTFDAPVTTDDSCQEGWVGEAQMETEAHTLLLVRTAVDQGTLYISLPEGLSVLPADRDYFRQLNTPLALSPWTWVVPGEWLFQHDNFVQHENIGRLDYRKKGEVDRPYPPAFLQENAKKIKDILREEFPFKGNDSGVHN